MLQFHFHHLCIQTACYEQSLDFYCRILGAELVKETPNFHTRAFNTWLQLGNFAIELQTAKAEQVLNPTDKNTTGLVHFCLFTPQLEAAITTIQSRGYQHFQRKNDHIIYHVEGSSLAKIIAPEGTIIELRDSSTI